MDYLPLQIPIKNQKCVVFGAGDIAYRRILTLCDCGAEVVVIAPVISAQIELLCVKNALVCVVDGYREDYLKDAFLVAACTNDVCVNQQIYNAAVVRGIIVYTADQRREKSVVFPALIDKAGLIVSLSSAGAYPMLTKYLKKRIDAALPDFIDATFIKRLEDYRKQIITTIDNRTERKRALRAFFDACIAEGENSHE